MTGVVFLALAIDIGYSVVESIVFMIGIIVANVPEGLLPQLSLALTIIARRMKAKKVIASNLEIIETLGAVSVICSDKTGTLTCNRMTVSHIFYNEKVFKTPETPVLQGDDFEFYDINDPHFKVLQRVISLNTDAEFLTYEDNIFERKTKGDASETALIKFIEAINNINECRKENPRVFGIPFNSTNKWMLSINNMKDETKNDKLMLSMKGAPEKILNMCNRIFSNNQIQALSQAKIEELEKINDLLAKRGERVLGFSFVDLPSSYTKSFKFQTDPINFQKDNLIFAGFISLVDPPRPTVKSAIHCCHEAGIKVFMVTGDHPTTAKSIAQSLNLITSPTEKDLLDEGICIPIEGVKSIVVTGSEIANFTSTDWDRVLNHEEIVFARTMPQQKQDIVRELNKLGHIVAMTGDGVNDAPAWVAGQWWQKKLLN